MQTLKFPAAIAMVLIIQRDIVATHFQQLAQEHIIGKANHVEQLQQLIPEQPQLTIHPQLLHHVHLLFSLF